MPAPHLRAIAPEDMGETFRARWQRARERHGEATLIEVGANAPHMIDWYYQRFYGEVFDGGRVDKRTKELARLKLSTMHGCAFCNRGNTLGALEAGVSQAEIDALRDPDDPVFSAADRAVLRLAEEIALQNMDGSLSPALHADLRAHFDDGQIFELGMVMAVMTGMAKFLFVFDLVSREANCPIGPPAD